MVDAMRSWHQPSSSFRARGSVPTRQVAASPCLRPRSSSRSGAPRARRLRTRCPRAPRASCRGRRGGARSPTRRPTRDCPRRSARQTRPRRPPRPKTPTQRTRPAAAARGTAARCELRLPRTASRSALSRGSPSHAPTSEPSCGPRASPERDPGLTREAEQVAILSEQRRAREAFPSVPTDGPRDDDAALAALGDRVDPAVHAAEEPVTAAVPAHADRSRAVERCPDELARDLARRPRRGEDAVARRAGEEPEPVLARGTADEARRVRVFVEPGVRARGVLRLVERDGRRCVELEFRLSHLGDDGLAVPEPLAVEAERAPERRRRAEPDLGGLA